MVEPYPRFGHAAWEYFYDVPTVSIICRPSLTDVCTKEDIQAYMFDGNVFGFREVNAKWQELERFANLKLADRLLFSLFGGEIIDKVRDHIKTNYNGQAPVFTSFVIRTNHPIIKHLVYICASLLRKQPDPKHPYHSLWSGLLAIQNFNSNNTESIERFATKGFQVANLDCTIPFYHY